MPKQYLSNIEPEFRFSAGYDGIAIRFDNGWAWGNTKTGKLVCLGREQDVKQAIQNLKLKSHIPDIDQIIELERTLLKEEVENYGTIIKRDSRTTAKRSTGSTGNRRAGLMLYTRNRPKNTRRIASKGIPSGVS